MSSSEISQAISEVLTDFHSVIFKILKIVKKLEPDNPDLDWLQNRLGLARDVDPLLIIETCKEKIWYYREFIIAKDEKFFVADNFGKFIKNDERKTFMYTLINLIRRRLSERSPAEKEKLWEFAQSMLKSVIQYKKLTE
jgi:hypothetical protein